METSYSNRNTNTTAPSFLHGANEVYNVEASHGQYNPPVTKVQAGDNSSILTNASQPQTQTQPVTNLSYDYSKDANFLKKTEAQVSQQAQPAQYTNYSSPQAVPQPQATPLVYGNQAAPSQQTSVLTSPPVPTQSYATYTNQPYTNQPYTTPVSSTSTTHSYVIQPSAPVTTTQTYTLPSSYANLGQTGSYVSYSSQTLPPTQYIQPTQYVSSYPVQSYVSSLPAAQGTTTYLTQTPIGSQTHLVTDGSPYVSNYVQQTP